MGSIWEAFVLTGEWDVDKIMAREELRRLLKVCMYERAALQKRLDVIRTQRDRIIRLLDIPTLQEHLDAGGDVLDYMKNPKGGHGASKKVKAKRR